MLRWTVSISLIVLTCSLLDWEAMRTSISRLTFGIFLWTTLFAMPSFLLLALRWHMLLRPRDDGGVVRHIAGYLVALFFNTFTPGALGADAYRLISLKSRVAASELFLLLLRERYLGLISIVLLLLGGSAGLLRWGDLPSETAHWLRLVDGVLALSLCSMYVGCRLMDAMARPQAHRHTLLMRLHKALALLVQAMAVRPLNRTVPLCVLSLAASLAWLYSISYVAKSLAVPIPFSGIIVVFTLVELIRFIPISVQGIGMREGACAALFGALGFDPANGMVIGATVYAALQVSLLAMSALGLGLRAWLGGQGRQPGQDGA